MTELTKQLGLNTEDIFTEAELAGAMLEGECHRTASYPLSGVCTHTETYTSDTETPITDFFEYSEDMGGYVFVGPTE